MVTMRGSCSCSLNEKREGCDWIQLSPLKLPLCRAEQRVNEANKRQRERERESLLLSLRLLFSSICRMAGRERETFRFIRERNASREKERERRILKPFFTQQHPAGCQLCGVPTPRKRSGYNSFLTNPPCLLPPLVLLSPTELKRKDWDR